MDSLLRGNFLLYQCNMKMVGISKQYEVPYKGCEVQWGLFLSWLSLFLSHLFTHTNAHLETTYIDVKIYKFRESDGQTNFYLALSQRN